MKYIYLALYIMLTRVAHSEPQPWGIIVKGPQCAQYWAGDECNLYKAPEGWSQLYGETIKYRGKECKFSQGQEENCCKQLGLKFIDLKLEKDLPASQTEFCKTRSK